METYRSMKSLSVARNSYRSEECLFYPVVLASVSLKRLSRIQKATLCIVPSVTTGRFTLRKTFMTERFDAPFHPTSPNWVIQMPLGITQYNGNNEPCDALVGPCSCGAWHQMSDWPEELLDYIQEQRPVLPVHLLKKTDECDEVSGKAEWISTFFSDKDVFAGLLTLVFCLGLLLGMILQWSRSL